MTPKQREVHVFEIKATLRGDGWVEDRWGNFKKDNSRVKFQKTSIRHEVKMGGGWLNLKSDYTKNIVVQAGIVFIKGRMIG